MFLISPRYYMHFVAAQVVGDMTAKLASAPWGAPRSEGKSFRLSARTFAFPPARPRPALTSPNAPKPLRSPSRPV